MEIKRINSPPVARCWTPCRISLAMEGIAIQQAFADLLATVTQLEDRIRTLGNPDAYSVQREQNLQSFSECLLKLSHRVEQVANNEQLTLQKSLQTFGGYNSKCRGLLNQVQETISRLHPEWLSPSDDDIDNSDALEEFFEAPVKSSSAVANGSPAEAFQFSSSLARNLAGYASPLKLGTLRSEDPLRDSPDLNTPPMQSTLSLQINGTPTRNTDSPTLADAENTPRLENIGLSTRSFAFLRSLVSPSPRPAKQAPPIECTGGLPKLTERLSLNHYERSSLDHGPFATSQKSSLCQSEAADLSFPSISSDDPFGGAEFPDTSDL